MDVYRNFPDFRQNKMRCYVMNIIETIDSTIAVLWAQTEFPVHEIKEKC